MILPFLASIKKSWRDHRQHDLYLDVVDGHQQEQTMDYKEGMEDQWEEDDECTEMEVKSYNPNDAESE